MNLDEITRDNKDDAIKGMLVLGYSYSQIVELAKCSHSRVSRNAKELKADGTLLVPNSKSKIVNDKIYFDNSESKVSDSNVRLGIGFYRFQARCLRIKGYSSMNINTLKREIIKKLEMECGIQREDLT